MAVTIFFDRLASKFRAAVDHRVSALLRRIIQRIIHHLVCERTIQALGHCEVLRRAVEHILFLQEHVVNSFPVNFAGEQESLLLRPNLLDSSILVILWRLVVPLLVAEGELRGGVSSLFAVWPFAILLRKLLFVQRAFQEFHFGS